MYGIFTYSWLIFMVNVGKHTIHGSYEFNRKPMLKRCRYQDVVAGQFFGHEHRFLPATHLGSLGFGHDDLRIHTRWAPDSSHIPYHPTGIFSYMNGCFDGETW